MPYFIGFDLETKGDFDGYALQPCRLPRYEARITSCAFVSQQQGTLLAKLNPEPKLLQDELHIIECFGDNVFIVGWNVLFDIAWLIAAGLEEEVRKLRWLDGMVLMRMAFNDTSLSKSYSLKEAVREFLSEFADYEKGVDLTHVDDTLLKYNTMDAELTVRLAKIFWDKLSDRQRNLASLISEASVPLAAAWLEGLSIDRNAFLKWERDLSVSANESFATLNRLTGTAYPDKLLKALNSPKKLKGILKILGFNVASVDRSTLSRIRGDETVDAIASFRQASSMTSKFVDPIRSSIEYNKCDKTYPAPRIWNTYTGRFGYRSKTLRKYQSGISIHQLPRDKAARNCICSPQGYLLAEFDFKQQESRLLCDFSEDPVLQKIFNDNLDFHSYMGAIIANQSYDDFVKSPDSARYRQLAKVVNLACAYRTGWSRLVDVARTQFGVDIDSMTAQMLHSLFRTTYKNVPHYWDYAIEAAQKRGYAESRGGRRVYLEDWSIENTWQAESTAINFPIQATGADMKCLAISSVDKILYENGGKYLFDLHDALFCLVPDSSKGYDLAKHLNGVLSDLPYYEAFGWLPLVRLPVDGQIGHNWGTLEGIK